MKIKQNQTSLIEQVFSVISQYRYMLLALLILLASITGCTTEEKTIFPEQEISALALVSLDPKTSSFVFRDKKGNRARGLVGDSVGSQGGRVIEVSSNHLVLETMTTIKDQEGKIHDQISRTRLYRSDITGRGKNLNVPANSHKKAKPTRNKTKSSQGKNLQNNKKEDAPQLHLAISEKQIANINSLLENKTDVNQFDADGRTPLLLAITTGEQAIVKLLLQHGADVNLKGIGHRGKDQAYKRMGRSLIMASGYDKNPNRFPNNNIIKPATKHSPLFEAIDQGKNEIALILLDAGADVHSPAEDSLNLALSKTMAKGDPALIKVLLQKGAVISANKDAISKGIQYGIRYQLYDLADQALAKLSAHPEPQRVMANPFRIIFGHWRLELDKKMITIFIKHGLVQANKESNSLNYAIQYNKVKSCRALLEANIKPTAALLEQAINSLNFEIADLLIEYGVDINSLKNGLGHYLDSTKDRDNIIEFLLKNNIDINKLHNKEYPLARAVYRGKTKWIKLLIEKGAKPTPQDAEAIELMIAASASHRLEIINLLIANNYPVNSDDLKQNENTPLCSAMSSPETVASLLAAGADLDHPCTDKKFTTILWKGYEKTAEMLLDAGIKGDYQKCKSFIFNKTKNSLSSQLFEKLLKTTPVNEQDSRGKTLLMHSSQAGRLDIANILLNHGADISLGDKNKKTALTYAARHGKAQLVELLLDHGAQINSQNKYGMSALSTSISGGDLATVQLLVKRGADVHGIGPMGLDTYATAMTGKRTEIAKYLLSVGASSEIYDRLVTEKETFLTKQAKIFPGIDEKMSLNDYLRMKIMLKTTVGITDPVNWQPNPELSTPEKTWAYYKKMLLTGETEKALACHLPSSAEKFREIYKNIGPEKRSKFINNMQEIEKVEITAGTAEYRLKREIKGDSVTFYINFAKAFGEWRIRDF